MGWSYTHVALFGPTQQQVAAALADRQAVISPTVSGFTLVADEEFESHDEGRISAFAAGLSKALGCPALVVYEFDDDVLPCSRIPSTRFQPAWRMFFVSAAAPKREEFVLGLGIMYVHFGRLLHLCSPHKAVDLQCLMSLRR